jgi:hypothetical protein
VAEAICIRCGRPKRAPSNACDSCGFVPQNDALVESVYFSTLRYDEEEERRPYRKVLDRYSKEIEDGLRPEVDGDEIERLRAEKALFDEGRYSGGRIALGYFRVFGPIFLVLAILIAVVTILGRLVGHR